jgi:hypothetical protein
MLNESFITHDFQLPNHSNELCKAEEIIEKFKSKLKLLEKNKFVTDQNHITLYEEIVRILDYVGRLSMPAFAIEEELERMYVLQYPKSPELAKKLWSDHYEQIHHPYTLLKNRCFRMLEDLDNLYIKLNKKNPPNWNI